MFRWLSVRWSCCGNDDGVSINVNLKVVVMSVEDDILNIGWKRGGSD